MPISSDLNKLEKAAEKVEALHDSKASLEAQRAAALADWDEQIAKAVTELDAAVADAEKLQRDVSQRIEHLIPNALSGSSGRVRSSG